MILIINTTTAYAQIQTGNASAQTSVQTNVEGSSNVSTHIEVQANGEKKVLDTNSPGTYSLSVQSNDDNSQTITPTPTPTPTITLSPKTSDIPKENTATYTATIENNQKKEILNQSFLSNLITHIENFFKKIFSASR
jgi:hypothetical protein